MLHPGMHAKAQPPSADADHPRAWLGIRRSPCTPCARLAPWESAFTSYSGKVSGDTIKGKAESERDGKTQSRDWEAKRAKE